VQSAVVVGSGGCAAEGSLGPVRSALHGVEPRQMAVGMTVRLLASLTTPLSGVVEMLKRQTTLLPFGSRQYYSFGVHQICLISQSQYSCCLLTNFRLNVLHQIG